MAARTTDELMAATDCIGTELRTFAAVSRRRLHKEYKDAIEHNAYTESQLVHARNLIEFLLADRPPSGDRDDMWPGEFTQTWDVETELGDERVTRLRNTRTQIHKHLAHLTWTRTKREPEYVTPVGGIIEAMVLFARHLESERSPIAARFLASCAEARAYSAGVELPRGAVQ